MQIKKLSPETQRQKDTSAEKKAYLEYLIALRDAGVDVERDLQKLYESSRNMLTDV